MIDRFQIRGGNFIFDENKNPVKVTRDILRSLKKESECEKYSAIPLTSYWLQELGFKKNEISNEYHHENLSFKLRRTQESNEWEVIWSNETTTTLRDKLRTVHQLQNFAFDWNNSRLHYSKK